MDPVTAIGTRGIAHRRELLAAGVRAVDLRDAIADRSVRRAKRDWYYTADCHPYTLRAVMSSATLTCVSAAEVHEIWSGVDTHIHVAAARSNGRIDPAPKPTLVAGSRPLVVHWTRRPLPGPMPRVRAVIDDVPTMLKRVARCQTHEQAVAVFDSAVRTELISLHELRAIGEVSGAGFRGVVDAVHPLADSGIESLPRVRFANVGITMTPQVVIDGHPVDGLIGDRLVMQFDGWGVHGGRKQRNRDLAQDERLQKMGYVVLRYTYDQVLEEWPMILSTVRSIMAQGRHLWPR